VFKELKTEALYIGIWPDKSFSPVFTEWPDDILD